MSVLKRIHVVSPFEYVLQNNSLFDVLCPYCIIVKIVLQVDFEFLVHKISNKALFCMD
nr:MAG TPA: Thioredoxin [Caudoviricetes sp.]